MRKIGVIGGGTAGYLAALTIKRLHPTLEVSLVESSRIPVIGVGEATTSEIVPYLHHVLDFDVSDFFRKVRPTFKLGIRFEWGRPGRYFFNYPFDRGNLLESYLHDGHIRNATILSHFMTLGRIPLLAVEDQYISLLSELPYGYHLENESFIRYLRDKAVELEINYLDREIDSVTLSEDRKTVRGLHTTEEETLLEFDLYVDCTGFRSMLLGEALRSHFIDYGKSLFTDVAIIARTPNDDVIHPYTTASTMNYGWCWTIPLHDGEDHIGYVFSSDFCTDEHAQAELQAAKPRARDFRRVRFRSGRRQHFWQGNVVAVGNSYGFVEPLESTAIYMICRECLLLAQNLLRPDQDTSARLNAWVASSWDYLRWFLAVHYKFNKRINSPFWRECRANVDISGAEPIVQRFKSFGSSSENSGDGTNFDSFGYDALLFGQHVPAELSKPAEEAPRYIERISNYLSLASEGVNHKDGLELLQGSLSDLLESSTKEPESWVSLFWNAMKQQAS